MLDLLLDTTGEVLMWMLVKDGNTLARYDEANSSHRYHSAILLPSLQEAVAQQGLTLRDVNRVAVNTGPGSFTGIRTGLIVAKLLGQFGGQHLYGFNTFELLAGHPAVRGQSVTILLDAFRQQHYRAALTVNDKGEIDWQEAPQVLTNDQLDAIRTQNCWVGKTLVDKLSAPMASFCKTHHVVESLGLFTPDTMNLYMQHCPERFRLVWETLKPLYLQLPHISTPKSAQTVI